METQSIDSQAEKDKLGGSRKTEPLAQEPKVIPLVRTRRRRKKSQLIVFREDDEKNLR